LGIHSNREEIIPWGKIISILELTGCHVDTISSRRFYAGHRKYLNPLGNSGIEPPTEFQSRRHVRNKKHINSAEFSEHLHHLHHLPHLQDYPHSVPGGSVLHRNHSMDFDAHSRSKHHDEDVRKFKRAIGLVKQAVSLERYNAVHPEEWVEEVTVGVRIWTNKVTGEVCTECPWRDQLIIDKMFRKNSFITTTVKADSSPTDPSTVGSSPLGNNSKGNQRILGATRIAALTQKESASVLPVKPQTAPAKYTIRGGSEFSNPEDLGTGSLVYDNTEVLELFQVLEGKKKNCRK
jgi:hypothetical protein